MKINKLILKNFRNYKHLDIEFSNNINIFYGNNGQGKTNILEAIYILATTKSHKNSSDKEIIKFDEKEAFIHGYFNEEDISMKVDISIEKNKKKEIIINNLKLNRINEHIGNINIIIFSPEDLKIINSSPSKRRSFIDTEICQINRIYMNNLSIYKQIIEQRNKLLKEISLKKDKNLILTLDIWDEQLIKYGIEIIKERERFINKISNIIKIKHEEITNSKDELKVIYKKNVEEFNFREELKKNREKDLKYICSNVGPHRDDIDFYINDIDAKIYGSQGQQRTIALILKLSEIEIIKNVYNKNPILLLDDVLSELDRKRQKLLLKMINNIQTFITCTGIEEFINENIDINSIYEIKNGEAALIRRRNNG